MMEDVFGSGFLNHMSAVARESNDLRELVHKEIFRPVWDKVEMFPLGIRLDLNPYRCVNVTGRGSGDGDGAWS